jgi:hypothetical protein
MAGLDGAVTKQQFRLHERFGIRLDRMRTGGRLEGSWSPEPSISLVESVGYRHCLSHEVLLRDAHSPSNHGSPFIDLVDNILQ